MSLMLSYSTQVLAVESIMMMLLSIRQGNTVPALPRMTVVSAHPSFLMSIAKTWGFR